MGTGSSAGPNRESKRETARFLPGDAHLSERRASLPGPDQKSGDPERLQHCTPNEAVDLYELGADDTFSVERHVAVDSSLGLLPGMATSGPTKGYTPRPTARGV